MSDPTRGKSLASDPSPLALLVDAANAQSQESSRAAGSVAASSLDSRSCRDGSERSALNQAAAIQHLHGNEVDWRELLQREALQRESLEREAIERELLHRQATLMAYGGLGGLPGLGAPEADYLQQLRLEALIQRRRHEALAQLALAQEIGMGPDLHALLQAQQLRQAALLRQDMMLSNVVNPSLLGQESVIAGLGETDDPALTEEEQRREMALRKDKYEQQQKLANMSFGGPPTNGGRVAKKLKTRKKFSSPEVDDPSTNNHDLPSITLSSNLEKKYLHPKHEGTTNEVESNVVTIPCPARGMPSDHNPSTAYYKITSDIKHGADLVCSYYACRNSGAQYRYCAICREPVSKWSFAKLHKHDNALPPVAPEGKNDAQTILTQLIERGSRVVVDPEDESHLYRLEEGGAGRQTVGPQLQEEDLAERQARWDSLLEARLQPTESITDWVERVLEVSDFGYDFDGDQMNHSSNMENGRAASRDQIAQEGSDDGSEQETGEYLTTGRNYSSDDMDSEINQHNGTPDTTDSQMMDVDSTRNTTVKPSYESRTTGATNMETDNRGQFDDASTSSDDSVDLRANKHYMASN